MGVRRLLEGASLMAIAGMASGICSIEGEGDAGAGGAAAAGGDDLDELLAPSSSGDAAGAGDGDAGAGAGDGGDGAAAPDPAEWMKSFSGEKPEAGGLSNQEWLAKTGVKDLDHLVQLTRDNQKAARTAGIKVPGEGATEAEVTAFREALGVPKEAGGYEVKLPEGIEGFEVDSAFLGPLQELAHKHNVPKGAFEALAGQFMAAQAETAIADAANAVKERDAVLKEWGADADARKGEFRRGAEILGLNKSAIQSIQNGFGVKATMNLLAKVGSLAGEDFFASAGSASQRFGVADGAAAQKQIDAMVNDPEMAAKLRAQDPVAVGRYNRLIEAKAAFDEAEARGRKR
jgi:hypothetical protein